MKRCNSKLDALQASSKQSVSQAVATITVTTHEPTSTAANTPAANIRIPSTGCENDTFSTTYTTAVGYTFDKTCNRQFIGSDLVGVVVDSWDLYMEACGTFNHFNTTKGAFTCVGLTFFPSWVVESYAKGNISMWSNCLLQSQVPDVDYAPNTRTFEVVVSTLRS